MLEESLFNKVAGLKLLSCEYWEIYKTPILKNIYERLLLKTFYFYYNQSTAKWQFCFFVRYEQKPTQVPPRKGQNPFSKYFFEVDNKDTKTRFMVDVLVLLLLTLNMYFPTGKIIFMHVSLVFQFLFLKYLLTVSNKNTKTRKVLVLLPLTCLKWDKTCFNFSINTLEIRDDLL